MRKMTAITGRANPLLNGIQHEFLSSLLAENGFDLLTVYGDDSFEPAGETTQRAIYVAKKTGKEN